MGTSTDRMWHAVISKRIHLLLLHCHNFPSILLAPWCNFLLPIYYILAHCYINLPYFIYSLYIFIPSFYGLRERNLHFLLYTLRYYYRIFYIFISTCHVYSSALYSRIFALLDECIASPRSRYFLDREWVGVSTRALLPRREMNHRVARYTLI